MGGLGLSAGLATLVGEEDQDVAVRIFLLDNSGSTASYDGKYLDGTKFVACSRWKEIQVMAIFQAEWNVALETPCEFVLLNPPSSRSFARFREGVDFVSIDPRRGNTTEQVSMLRKMLERTRPQGTTPLFERMTEIHHRIKHDYSHLAVQGLKAIVVIATDGLPTLSGSAVPSDEAKRQVVQALRKLTGELPVFVVVRLCTNEDNVVEYYNKVDEEEELPLEVIDDIESEAKEIKDKGNGWLTYSPLIHAIREGGTFVKLLDLLDERLLTPLEVRLLSGHLLQLEGEEPLPLSDAAAFARMAEERLRRAPLEFDPLKRRHAPCVNLRQLKRAARVTHGPFACFKWLLPCVRRAHTRID